MTHRNISAGNCFGPPFSLDYQTFIAFAFSKQLYKTGIKDSVSYVMSRGDYFGFGFTTLNRKPI